ADFLNVLQITGFFKDYVRITSVFCSFVLKYLNMRRKFYLLVLFLFFVQDLMAQCAMCKAVAEEQASEGESTINSGILYIMVIPYIILFIAFRKKIFGFLKELKTAGVSRKQFLTKEE